VPGAHTHGESEVTAQASITRCPNTLAVTARPPDAPPRFSSSTPRRPSLATVERLRIAPSPVCAVPPENGTSPSPRGELGPKMPPEWNVGENDCLLICWSWAAPEAA